MSTESVTSALHEILSIRGWRTKRISFDPSRSLVPAIVKTSKEIQKIEEEEEDVTITQKRLMKK